MANYLELTIEQGATFTTSITVLDANNAIRNLVSYTVESQMRKSFYSSTAEDFTIEIANAAGGVVVMTMPATQTANLTPGRYVYDINMISTSNTVTRLFEGSVAVTPGVTHST